METDSKVNVRGVIVDVLLLEKVNNCDKLTIRIQEAGATVACSFCQGAPLLFMVEAEIPQHSNIVRSNALTTLVVHFMSSMGDRSGLSPPARWRYGSGSLILNTFVF